MFEAFRSVFLPDAGEGAVSVEAASIPSGDDGLDRLRALYGGTSFNRGIYRVIGESAVSQLGQMVSIAFPGFTGRISCFAVDWLGRVFALDAARQVDGRAGVVMFEPGTAQALEIPCNVATFHDSELIQYREEALAESFYDQWLSRGGVSPSINQCIAYRRPLFLGGSDTVENLELSDLDVYWTIAAQLIEKTRGLPPGASIQKIDIA